MKRELYLILFLGAVVVAIVTYKTYSSGGSSGSYYGSNGSNGSSNGGGGMCQRGYIPVGMCSDSPNYQCLTEQQLPPGTVFQPCSAAASSQQSLAFGTAEEDTVDGRQNKRTALWRETATINQ